MPSSKRLIDRAQEITFDPSTTGLEATRVQAALEELSSLVEAVETTPGPAGPAGPIGPAGPPGVVGATAPVTFAAGVVALDESGLVHRAGAETIAGAKTFADAVTHQNAVLAVPAAFAIGAGAHGTLGGGAVVIGSNTVASGANGVAVGINANANGSYATALGNGATASGNLSTAVGGSTSATHVASICLGRGATSTVTYGLTVGSAAEPTNVADFVSSASGFTLAAVVPSSTATLRKPGNLNLAWADATDATRKGRLALSAVDHNGTREGLRVEADGAAARLGFLGAAAVVRPTVSGSRAGNAALASLISALAALGLVTDSTTA